MKSKTLFMLMLFALLVLVACNAAAGVEPANETTDPSDTPVVEEIVVTAADKVSVANCPEPAPGAYQLIYAAEGICFLYPDNYDVFQGEDGSLTLYVRSLLNT